MKYMNDKVAGWFNRDCTVTVQQLLQQLQQTVFQLIILQILSVNSKQIDNQYFICQRQIKNMILR